MRKELLRTFLEQEIEIRATRDNTQAQRNVAEEALVVAEGKIHAVSRVIPFIGKNAKVAIDAAQTTMERSRREAA